MHIHEHICTITLHVVLENIHQKYYPNSNVKLQYQYRIKLEMSITKSKSNSNSNSNSNSVRKVNFNMVISDLIYMYSHSAQYAEIHCSQPESLCKRQLQWRVQIKWRNKQVLKLEKKKRFCLNPLKSDAFCVD